MEARTIGWSIAVAVVATFGFVAMFAIERETTSRDLGQAQSALSEAKGDLDSSREALERMHERVEQARKLSASKSGASAELTKIEAAISTADRKKEESKKAWEAVRNDYQASVATVRRKMTGSKFPTLEAGGLTLEDVTLKSVNDGVVTLEHSAGLTKVPGDKLPPKLAAALLPDLNPRLEVPATPAPSPSESAIEAAASARTVAGLPLDPAPASLETTVNPHTTQRIKLQNERSALALKMDAANGELQLRSSTYHRLNREYQNSRLRSRIVTVPPGLAEARKAMDVLSRQLETARRQYNRISVELQELVDKEGMWTPPNP